MQKLILGKNFTKFVHCAPNEVKYKKIKQIGEVRRIWVKDDFSLTSDLCIRTKPKPNQNQIQSRKSGSRERSQSWQNMATILNLLDGFDVTSRSVRYRVTSMLTH